MTDRKKLEVRSESGQVNHKIQYKKEYVPDRKHSELPWNLHEYEGNIFISSKDDEYNICDDLEPQEAEFIVRACNSHYELVEALDQYVNRTGKMKLMEIRNLLKKAKGETQ